jgi:gamma-glutamyl hydrolase
MVETQKKFLQDSGSSKASDRIKYNFGNNTSVNDRPIIGVLTQPLTDAFKADPRFKGKSSYIMASYINFLESAGARTVPLIFDGKAEDELAKIDHLNGVFYCGGGAGGAYDVFGKSVYNKAKGMNDQGNYLPVWGTCLGFENLAMFSSDDGNTVLESGFDSDDDNFVLHYTSDPQQTRLFSPLGADAAIFAQKPIAYNHHVFGVTPNRFLSDRGLSEIFTPTAISYDIQGRAFVAAMESKKYPFFGVMFHPEKAQFIFHPSTKIDHSEDSIYYNRYFADFFINQCKMNANKFDSYTTEISMITENYSLINTGYYNNTEEGYYGAVYAF